MTSHFTRKNPRVEYAQKWRYMGGDNCCASALCFWGVSNMRSYFELTLPKIKIGTYSKL